MIRNKLTFCLLSTMMTLGLSQLSLARDNSLSSTVEENEPEQTIVEVLAQSVTRDGQGEIQVLRHPGDGVSIVKTFPLDYRYETPVMIRELSAEDQLAIVYQDLTGKELPLVAYEAMQAVEAQKARNAASGVTTMDALQNSPVEPSAASGCNDTTPNDNNVFLYDCYVYGNMTRTEYADDVCLLVAAVKGDVSMQISYWSSSKGKYINTYKTDVKQGYYKVKELYTAFGRFRRGRIYNANSSEYSRFLYDGDAMVVIHKYWIYGARTFCSKF